jgi:protein-disulfide isomerase
MRRIFTKQPDCQRRRWLTAFVLAVGSVAALYWHLGRDGSASAHHNGPPWTYGPTEARFTVVEYADLECPYCKAHFAVMQQWIDQAAARESGRQAKISVNWQWQHLPLSGHEPAASQSAFLAECAGRVHGNDAFWKTVEWLYQHTRSNGLGVPIDTPFPDLTSLHACLENKAVMQQIKQQVSQAHQAGTTSTPTLIVKDNHTGKSMRFEGPASGDVVLSAIDMLVSASSSTSSAPSTPHGSESNMPVDTSVNDMPR